MKKYCSCKADRTGETSLDGGIVVCTDCEKPLCCDAVTLGLTSETPHPAETVDGTYFICWRHFQQTVWVDIPGGAAMWENRRLRAIATGTVLALLGLAGLIAVRRRSASGETIT